MNCRTRKGFPPFRCLAIHSHLIDARGNLPLQVRFVQSPPRVGGLYEAKTPPLGKGGALPNNSGIAKDIADLCWVMAIGDGRSPILEEPVPQWRL
jgi:hypothetical protein